MTVPNITCVNRALVMISIETQYVTEVHGGGGGGRVFNGHGQIVMNAVRSNTRQIQTAWFRDCDGKETSRTLHDVDLQGRLGHIFHEIELQSPGRENQTLRYVNITTGAVYPIQNLYDLGVKWGMVQRPWEAGGGTALLGAILGISAFGMLNNLFNAGSRDGGLFMTLIVHPLIGAMLLSFFLGKRINAKRFKAYRQFEAAVNDAIDNADRI